MEVIKKTKFPFRASPARIALASLACSAVFLAITFAVHSHLSSQEKGRQLRRRVYFHPYPATTISPHRLPELLSPVDESMEEMMHEASAAMTQVTEYPAQVDGGGDLLGYSASTIEDNQTVILNKQIIVETNLEASDDEYPIDDSDEPKNNMRLEEDTNDLSTLRETLRARSLEAKLFITNLLHEAFSNATEPNPRYSLQHPQDLYSQTENDRSCGQLDAFAGIPIHDSVGNGPWVPPIGSAPEKMKKWDTSYRIAMRKIKDVPVGGSGLRDVAEVEVQDLRAVRHNLFCKQQ